MRFLDIEMKNIWAIGNTPIKIDLCASPTTLIGGPNGAGKSTFLQAVCYGLFGKLLSNKVNLQDAINRTNKRNLLVKVRFEKNGCEYLVVRGEKPKTFEIFKDGELVNQSSSSREYQKMLEVVLGMDFKTFSQIVALNKERYVPFLEMTPAQRRGVVDDLLGTMVYSIMDELCRADISTIKNDIAQHKRAYDVSKERIRGSKETLDAIKRKNGEYLQSIERRIEGYQSEIDSLNDENAKLQDDVVDGLGDKVSALNGTIADYDDLASEFERNTNESKKLVQFFQVNHTCPVCMQDISPDFSQSIRDAEQAKMDEIGEAAGLLVEKLTDIISRRDEAVDEQKRTQDLLLTIRENSLRIGTLQRSIESAKSEISSISIDDIKNAELELEKSMTASDACYTDLADANKKLEMVEFIRSATNDSGIKQKIIKDYIPVLNEKLNEFLSAMEFFIGIELDEGFNESFGSFNKTGFKYEQLSTGQKARVNLAIWLALLEVSAIKNRITTNFLVLDEILEPMDGDGVALFMKLCKDKLKDRNIFVISQRFDEFEELFDSSIRFKQVNDFTVVDDARS